MNLHNIEKLKNEYAGKKVLVVGLGRQGGGEGVVRFFVSLGAEVTVTDNKTKEELIDQVRRLSQLHSVKFSLGKHSVSDFITADLIIKGPSVKWDLPEIEEAQKRGIPVIMEISFFCQHCPAHIIGITGTRGKSTTSAMIFQALKAGKKTAYLAGNVAGVSTVSLLECLQEDDVVVLELSSWQLSDLHHIHFSPHVAVFTNFYPDHLNYYSNEESYFYDKKAVYMYQKKGDVLFVGEQVNKRIDHKNVLSKIQVVPATSFPGKLQFIEGRHNKENASLAYATAVYLSVDPTTAERSISEFKGLPHRQEILIKKNGITVINDSTSTTPTATIRALETFSGTPTILIFGGNAKSLPVTELIKAVESCVAIIPLPGTFTDEVLPLLAQYGEKIKPVAKNLEVAVASSLSLARSRGGEVNILFSPSATSFAQFKNEFDRGEQFRSVVYSLMK